MELEFKRDFERVQRRWDRFWAGENDTPQVGVVLPKEGVEPADKPPYMSGMTGDFEPVVDQVLAWAQTHEFLGDALPFYVATFGPDHFSSFLGADLRVNPESPTTSWAVPFVEDWDDVEIRFESDGKWWRRTAAFLQALRRRCEGRVLLTATTPVANLDALSAIRGPERLLMDLVECPAKIQRALDQVCGAYEEILDAVCEETGAEKWGSINRHGMYSTGRIALPQCDFSCMIGPAMFRDFVIPCLERETAVLDAAEYHLDGPGAIKHLEAICSIAWIDVIQWVPGSGEAQSMDWTSLYRRIDELGKGQIRGGDPETIKRLWDEYESRKLFFRMHAETREVAEKALRDFGVL